MRNRLILLASAFSLFALTTMVLTHASHAQGVLKPQVQAGFLVGPVGGINLVAYNSDAFPILNSEPECFKAQNGTGVAPWGGLSVEFPLGNPNELQNFIIGEVLYDSKSSKFQSVTGSTETTPTKLNGFVDDNSSVTTALEAQLSYLVINLAYKYNFTPGPSPIGPGIQVGPSVGIKTTANFDKTVTVKAISPTAKANGDEATVTVSSNTAVKDAQSLRIALRAQVTYDISFGPDWVATPTVGYDFPITKVDNSSDPVTNWHASSVFAGIYFRYFIHG